MLDRMPRLFSLLFVLLFASPAGAVDTIFGNPADLPGEGGDAVLPSGYKGVLWGIGPEALMAVRGHTMETLHATDPHLTWLIETPPAGESGGVQTVKWKFWDGKLMEAHIYYTGPFTKREGRELRNKFVTRYGETDYKAVERKRPQMLSSKVQWEPVREERWTWQDPYTIQLLQRTAQDEVWFLVRQSRVYEAMRLLQDKREREDSKSARVREIDLD
jgi:hypothetical protein